MMYCGKCGVRPRYVSPSGYTRSWCRECRNEASRRTRKMDRKREYDRAYYAANRERIRAQQNDYTADHSVENIQRVREWQTANPLRRACRVAFGAARRRFGEAPDFVAWEAIWYGSCFSCGLFPARGVDHRVPHSRGGRNIASNLQSSCLPCNLRKAAKVA